MQPLLIPVRFRETDARGLVSLANPLTDAYLRNRGLELSDGLQLRLADPPAGIENRIDWKVADGVARFDAPAGRWMAEVVSDVEVASALPAEHWARAIEPDWLGPLAGR